MSIQLLWQQFQDAVLANDPMQAFAHAAELNEKLASGEEPPLQLRSLSWDSWSASHPRVSFMVSGIVVKSLDPSLWRLQDYLVISQDPGEGTTVLVPR